jgi:hypothetical protein
MSRLYLLVFALLSAGSLLAGTIPGYGVAPFVATQVIACVNSSPNCASQTTFMPNQAVSHAGTLTGVGADYVTYNDYAATQYGIMHIAAASTISLNSSKGWATAGTAFEETLTISKPGFTGQTGKLYVTYHIDGNNYSSDSTVNHAFLQVITRVWSEYNSQGLQNSVQDYTGASVNMNYTIAQPFYFTFGTPFYLFFSMQATTGSFTIVPGTGGYNVNSISNGTATAYSDFSNTFILDGLEVQDINNAIVDASYESGSGTGYNQNGVVPEPSTLALAGGALLALGWWKRRRA